MTRIYGGKQEYDRFWGKSIWINPNHCISGPPKTRSIRVQFTIGFDASVLATDFVTGGAEQAKAGSITLHMLVGKALPVDRSELIDSKTFAQRPANVLRVLEAALRGSSVQQVIVTEHNRDSGQFEESPCVSSPADIQAAIENVLRSVDTSRSFQLSPASLIPGEGVNNQTCCLFLPRKT